MRYIDIRSKREVWTEKLLLAFYIIFKPFGWLLRLVDSYYPVVMFVFAGIWLTATITVILQRPVISMAQSVVDESESNLASVRFLSLDLRVPINTKDEKITDKYFSPLQMSGIGPNQFLFTDISSQEIKIEDVQVGDEIQLIYENNGIGSARVVSKHETSIDQLNAVFQSSQATYFFISPKRPLNLRAMVIAAN